MSDFAAPRIGVPTRTGTGGPQDDDPGRDLVQHVMGWILVVVVAMLVTRLGLL
ncbi:SCO1431 family membrane protein [Streptomyces sp. V4-01]|uniref:SCO1431 family membrane protein n=1 Tax=Actinacidiphila polyblastidii TaxID=3110430 RepID=A0ABU7P7C5_9ACTN|nr:SCO1431 family membrane protein [Streptomyces sp. V4-01]